MKVDYIKKRFDSRGLKVCRGFSGSIVVRGSGGFYRSFSSYNAAYNFYFKKI